MNHTQQAARRIKNAIELLREAKYELLQVRSDQHISVALTLAGLEETYNILIDPECTPGIEADYDPLFDDCVWDGDRIEATKTLLFHEHIANGG